jgi:hypothetical protein
MDDYSRCGYIYPIKEWLEVLDKCKIFKAEVENQHDMAKFLDLFRGSYKKMT